MELGALKELIRRRTGIDIRDSAERLLEDSVRARIAASGTNDGHDYYLRTLSDEGEFFHLVELIANNETYFCRDCPQLSFFAQTLVPRLLAAGRKRPLRILSAGCSSGEEAYSIGMVLAESHGEEAARLFSILGCDIDRDALERARSGLYRPFSFRGLDIARRKRWFDEIGESQWRIKDEIARMAEFRRLNLLGEEWPADFVDFDIVFFRNVSIYFDAGTRRKMQDRLASIMVSGAYLITGSAETLANDFGVFELRSENDNFYFVNSSPHDRARHRPPGEDRGRAPSRGRAHGGGERPRLSPPPSTREGAAGKATEPRRAPSLAQLRDMVRDKRYEEVLQATGTIASPLGAAGMASANDLKLLRSFVLLEQGRSEEAEVLAMQALEGDQWSQDACYLLGLAARRGGRAKEAIDWFRRAVYAETACWPAHYYLAELYREQGEGSRAGREYTIVLRAIGMGSGRDEGLSVLPLGMPAADLRLVCERRLAEAAE